MKQNKFLLNLIVAIGVSVIVNFAYLLSIWVINGDNYVSQETRPEIQIEGTLKLCADGYGYIIVADSISNIDSVYVSSSRAYRFGLRNGAIVRGAAEISRRPNANPSLVRVDAINGKEIDYAAMFNRPNDNVLAAIQVGYYLLFALIMCFIFTSSHKVTRSVMLGYVYRLCICLAVSLAAYSFAPVFDWRRGEFIFNFMSHQQLNAMVLLQCTFSLVVCALYGLTWVLLEQRSAIRVEMEHLKTEALEAQYAVLVNQINPHFLFNSLNSLSMLVREGNTKDSLGYIDRLSYTFRYIIGAEGRKLVSLDDELGFLNAYRYLLEVRYADKLFFDIKVDAAKRELLLPALSLQPLVENVVKHNTITLAQPMTITIMVEGDELIVSNPIHPKLEAEDSTGIGLRNLESRYSMLVGRNVRIQDTYGEFKVVLPLVNRAK
ncbi:MAG: histidine kinase [Rikenellaceae bacterium]|nr:histidine kinase [Rikenellaceae bacterium]